MTRERRPRVCFLFNHDQIHQVAHGLPVALALAERASGAEVIVATTNGALSDEVRRLGGEAMGTRLSLVELGVRSSLRRLLAWLAGRLLPVAKLLVYRDNLDFFRSLDLLVVPEKTSLLLKQRYGLRDLKLVHTRHGAGDRAIGFNRASGGFDLVLASGSKVRDRLIHEAGVSPERVAVVGYPKFDLYPRRASPRPRARRPIVLYNPHPAPHLSSWYSMGPAILDWFAGHPEYEVIFGPHIMLFQRAAVITVEPPGIARSGTIAPHIEAAENITVDTGSRALTTMEYVSRADVYLGDASSQVYEFLVEPRPCIFVDAHRSNWRGNPDFRHWTAGRVIDNVKELGAALESAFDEHRRRYRRVQEALLSETFDLDETPSSVRAAQAIARLADVSFAA